MKSRYMPSFTIFAIFFSFNSLAAGRLEGTNPGLYKRTVEAIRNGRITENREAQFLRGTILTGFLNSAKAGNETLNRKVSIFFDELRYYFSIYPTFERLSTSEKELLVQTLEMIYKNDVRNEINGGIYVRSIPKRLAEDFMIIKTAIENGKSADETADLFSGRIDADPIE